MDRWFLLVFQVPEPELKPLDQRGFIPGLFDLWPGFTQTRFLLRLAHIVSVGDSHLDLLALRSSIRKQYASHEQEKDDNFTYYDG